MELEIIFAALATNDAAASGPPGRPADSAGGEELLARFGEELARAFAAREDQLTQQGRLLPGAAEAVAEVGRLPGVVQSVLTGTIKPNALLKLRAFGLAGFFDTEVGGYGSQVYPKGAQLLMARTRATERRRPVRRAAHRIPGRLLPRRGRGRATAGPGAWPSPAGGPRVADCARPARTWCCGPGRHRRRGPGRGPADPRRGQLTASCRRPPPGLARPRGPAFPLARAEPPRLTFTGPA